MLMIPPALLWLQGMPRSLELVPYRAECKARHTYT